MNNRNPDPGCKHSPFNGITDLEHPAHKSTTFHKVAGDQSDLLFFWVAHGVTSSAWFVTWLISVLSVFPAV